MFEQIGQVFAQLAEVLRELPMQKKMAMALIVVVSMGAVLGVASMSGKPDYQVLFSGLALSDSSEITRTLVDSGVPYKLANDGAAILVPSEKVHELRLTMASVGLPTGGSVGYEIFNESTFGMTDFVQKLNFQRALQGELERTISQFREVKSARIHLASPERRLFSKEQQVATASVVLTMSSRRQLKKSQVMSIAHLVAASVENLSAENVTVVDVEGRVLNGGESSDEMARLSSTQLDYKVNLQKEIEKRITSMIERVVGPGRIVARVSADVDFRRVEKTEKSFDPNSQVARSEQRQEQKSSGAQGPSGVIGIQSNQPGAEGGGGVSPGKPPTSSSVQETINYELNEVVSHVVEPTGIVKKLSVAVIIDGKYTTATADDGTVSKEYEPRSKEELEQLKNLVIAAAGIDEKRGDNVTVQSSAFDNSQYKLDIEAATGANEAVLYESLATYGGMGALALLLFLFGLKPLMGWITATSTEMAALRDFPQTVEELESKLGVASSSGEAALDTKGRIREIILENPQATAEMLREWLSTRR